MKSEAGNDAAEQDWTQAALELFPYSFALMDLKKSCELSHKEGCSRYDQYKDRWTG